MGEIESIYKFKDLEVDNHIEGSLLDEVKLGTRFDTLRARARGVTFVPSAEH